MQARIQDFLKGGGGGEGQGGPLRGGGGGWSPLSAKNYYLNTHKFQLQGGGGWSTLSPPPPWIRHCYAIIIILLKLRLNYCVTPALT